MLFLKTCDAQLLRSLLPVAMNISWCFLSWLMILICCVAISLDQHVLTALSSVSFSSLSQQLDFGTFLV